jgi:hypothetical protein
MSLEFHCYMFRTHEAFIRQLSFEGYQYTAWAHMLSKHIIVFVYILSHIPPRCVPCAWISQVRRVSLYFVPCSSPVLLG